MSATYTHCMTAIDTRERCGVDGAQCRRCSRIDVLRAENEALRAELAAANEQLAKMREQKPVLFYCKTVEMERLRDAPHEYVDSVNIWGGDGVGLYAAPVPPAPAAQEGKP